MAERKIRFEDGAAYERMSGIWSRLVGAPFLDWLAPAPGLRWIDIGCGNGAFTELIVDRCAPSKVQGIDPSADQLVFARSRPSGRIAEFRHGDAMELPFPDNRFDAAVMALVIFFVPDPVRSVAEMARVACPGGIVASYTWIQDCSLSCVATWFCKFQGVGGNKSGTAKHETRLVPNDPLKKPRQYESERTR